MAENILTRAGDAIATGIKNFHINMYDLDSHPGTDHLAQALARGRIDGDDARCLLEHVPRLTNMLFEGLTGMFGEVTPRRFFELAEGGYLTRSVVERAMR